MGRAELGYVRARILGVGQRWERDVDAEDSELEVEAQEHEGGRRPREGSEGSFDEGAGTQGERVAVARGARRHLTAWSKRG